MKRTTVRVLIIIGVLGLAVWLVSTIYSASRLVSSLKNDLPMTYSLPKSYSDLLKTDGSHKIEHIFTLNNKITTPISFINYTDKFYIVIKQIVLKNADSLEKQIHLRLGPSERSTNVTYQEGDYGRYYSFDFQSALPDSAEAVYFTCTDRLPKIQRFKDDISYFDVPCDKFSFRFSESGITAIYGEPLVVKKIQELNYPVLVILVKKNEDLFFLFVSYNKEQNLHTRDFLEMLN